EGAALSDETIGFVDRHQRRRAAARGDVRAGAGQRKKDEQGEEPAEHGLHHTSLIKSKVRSSEWRYRLTVRTDGSQPSNRGSIPRTATIFIARSHSSLGYSPGRWPGLFCWGR